MLYSYHILTLGVFWMQYIYCTCRFPFCLPIFFVLLETKCRLWKIYIVVWLYVTYRKNKSLSYLYLEAIHAWLGINVTYIDIILVIRVPHLRLICPIKGLLAQNNVEPMVKTRENLSSCASHLTWLLLSNLDCSVVPEQLEQDALLSIPGTLTDKRAFESFINKRVLSLQRSAYTPSCLNM